MHSIFDSVFRHAKVATAALGITALSAPVASADFHKSLGRELGRALATELLRQGTQPRQQQQQQRAQPQRQQSTAQRAVNPAAAAEPNMSRSTKRQVQNALNTLGFNVGITDGIFGRGTRNGIGRWQAAQGFARTGYLTQTQLNALRSVQVVQPPVYTDPRQAPLTPRQTAELQQYLKAIGFYSGAIDGRAGPGTGQAVQSFLASQGHDANAVAPLFALQLAQSVVQQTPPPPVIPAAGALPFPGGGGASQTALAGQGQTAFPGQQQSGFPGQANSAFPSTAPTAFPGQAEAGGQVTAAQAFTPLSQQQVFALQTNLKQLGFYNGAVDGISGRGTERAMQQFLTNNGQPATAPPQFVMQLSSAIVGNAPRPLLQPDGSFVAQMTSTQPTQQGPKPLTERTIVELNGNNMSSPALLLMAIAAKPSLVDDNRVVQTIMNNNMFAQDIPIDRSQRNDPAQIAVFRTALRTLASTTPAIPELTFKIRGYLRQNGYDPQRQIWPLQQPIEASLRKYGVYQLNGIYNDQLFVEIPDLPDLLGDVPITPAEQLAIAGDGRQRNPEVDTYIHVKVDDLIFDSVRNQLQLKLTFDSADIRSSRSPILAKQISGGEAFVPGSDQSQPKYLQLAEIFRERAPDDARQTASVIDGYVNLSSNQRYRQNVMSGLYTAISLKLQPELLQNDDFAIEVAPLLLNQAETQRWKRGYESADVRSMNTFDRRELAERMRNEFGTVLNDRAYADQMRFVTFRNVQIGQYDFARGGFPLQVDNRRQIQDARLGLAINGRDSRVQMLLPNGFAFPDLLVMDETQARTFASRLNMGSGQIRARLGIFVEVPEFTRLETREVARQQGRSYTLAGGAVSAKVEAVKLFQDDQTLQLIADFEVKEDQQAVFAGKVLDLPSTTNVDMLAALKNFPNGPKLVSDYITQAHTVQQTPQLQRSEKIATLTSLVDNAKTGNSIWIAGPVSMHHYDPATQAFRANFALNPRKHPEMQNSDVYVQFSGLNEISVPLTESDLLEWVPGGDPLRMLEDYQGQISIVAHVVPQALTPSNNGRTWQTELGMIEYYIILGSTDRTASIRVHDHKVILPGLAVDVDVALAAAAAASTPDETVVNAKAELPADADEGAPSAPSRDILGVKLGMTLADAEAALGDRYAEGVTLDAMSSPDSTLAFQSGRTFIKPDGTERLTLYFEADVAEATVLAVERVMAVPNFQIPIEAVETSAVSKYGDPAVQDKANGLLLDWSPVDRASCPITFAQAQVDTWAALSGPESGPLDKFVDLTKAAGTTIAHVPSIVQDDTVTYADCTGETLFVQQDDRQIVAFLSDLAAYQAGYYAARGLNPDGSDPNAEVEDAAPAIEF